eukprot:1633406-Pyramimonas_sp.AAC.1
MQLLGGGIQHQRWHYPWSKSGPIRYVIRLVSMVPSIGLDRPFSPSYTRASQELSPRGAPWLHPAARRRRPAGGSAPILTYTYTYTYTYTAT